MEEKKKQKTNQKKEEIKEENKPVQNESPEKVSLKTENHEEKVLRQVLLFIGALAILMFGFLALSHLHSAINYEGIKYHAVSYGTGKDMIFYETLTLLPTNDGSNQSFGIRIRTNPKELKKIPFPEYNNYTLMKINGYKFVNATFNCNGDGVIAMPNMARLFGKMNADWIHDQNSTCDPKGRYNFFIFQYGKKTGIKQIGNHCYQVTVKGNDTSCQILPATEKVMADTYAKYAILKGK